MYKQCTHKTSDDFMRREISEDIYAPSKRLWTCSNCGKEETWNKSWSNYSKLECDNCGRIDITWVACSDECAEKLKQSSPTKDNGE